MAQSQFSLTWEGFKNSICGGISLLQQNGEFVDMTLAADGHLVKVHQMLIALASPYFKELIASASCPHPVIFLNNVTHRTLCSLLEYIYTGEVIVAADSLSEFFEVAKSLHIRGLDDLCTNNEVMGQQSSVLPQVEETSHSVDSLNLGGLKKVEVSLGYTVENVEVPLAAQKINVKRELSIHHPSDFPRSTRQAKKKKFSPPDNDSFGEVFEESAHQEDSDDEENAPLSDPSIAALNNMKTNLQFTVSNRGALQIILNRYLYNLNSKPNRQGVRRWRCVEYRNNRCLAFVTTKGNVVLNRANLHNHPFHDKRILQKIEAKSVYSAFDEVQRFKNTSEMDESMNDNDDETEDEKKPTD